MKLLRALWRAYVVTVRSPGGWPLLALPVMLLLFVVGGMSLAVDQLRAPAVDPSGVIAAAERRNQLAGGSDPTRLAPARADSLLSSTRAVDSLPDSTLTFIRAYANPAKDSARYALVSRTLDRRTVAAARAQVAARVAKVFELARDSKTDDGKPCTAATRVRSEQLTRAHPEWDDAALALVICRWMRIGMTADQLRASRGKPDRLHESVHSWGTKEQWVYGEDGSFYVYLENGVVTGWST